MNDVSQELPLYVIRPIPSITLYRNQRTRTAAQAAHALGVTPQQVGKSLAFLVNGEPLCVILRGDDRVDRGQLAVKIAIECQLCF